MASTGIIFRRGLKTAFLSNPPILGEIVFAIDTREHGMLDANNIVAWRKLEKLNAGPKGADGTNGTNGIANLDTDVLFTTPNNTLAPSTLAVKTFVNSKITSSILKEVQYNALTGYILSTESSNTQHAKPNTSSLNFAHPNADRSSRVLGKYSLTLGQSVSVGDYSVTFGANLEEGLAYSLIQGLNNSTSYSAGTGITAQSDYKHNTILKKEET